MSKSSFFSKSGAAPTLSADVSTLVDRAEAAAVQAENAAANVTSTASAAQAAAQESANSATAAAATASTVGVQVANAATSATNAASSATAAATSATNAANSAATADTHKTAAASSATSANSSATSASSSASSALTSATNAATSATNAANSATAATTAAAQAANTLASAMWRDVVFRTFASGTLNITSADNGKLFVLDTSGGAITVNLPQISTLSMPFNVGIKKNTSDANNVTINRAGTDLIETATSKVLNGNFGTQLLADTDPTPDKWTTCDFGVQPIVTGSIQTAHLADNAVTTLKINDSAVTNAKLGAGAVDNTKLASNAVNTGNIVDGSITRAKLASPTGDYFQANKNNVSQGSIVNAADTKVTFTNELADTAARYDAANSKFVPGNGEVWLINALAQTTDGNDGMATYLNIYKNGAQYRSGDLKASGSATAVNVMVTALVVGNGTDFYEVYFGLSNSTASRTINGQTNVSAFEGFRIR